MTKSVDLAIVGASGAIGEAMLELLAERDFPMGRLYLLDDERALGKKLEFRDRYLPVEAVQGFDFAKVQVALFAAGPELAGEYAPKAAAAGAAVIDTSGRFNGEADVPLVVAEVNSDDLGAWRQRGIVASPTPAVVQLAVVLKPLHDQAGIERVNVATYQAVSALGKEAVEELASQTAGLLNLKEIKPKRFPRQIAFNLIPQVDEFGDDGYTREEWALHDETRRLLGEPALALSATCVRVPVFYGHGMAVRIETRDKLSADAVRKLLKKAPGVDVLDVRKTGGYPTPVTEAARSDDVFVGRIREDISHPRGLNFWIVADNVRKGAALNGIQLAEILIRDYL